MNFGLATAPTDRAPSSRPRALEPSWHALPMAERIARAAARVDAGASEEDDAPPPSHSLRADQTRVLRDFAAFLLDVATRPDGDARSAFGRIILPPRTGKTIIAGHIIAGTALRATIIVPTKTLVVQTAREIGAVLPGVPIGVHFGERKDIAAHGVNIATYSILLRDHAKGALPPAIATSAIVFADEAHRAMTHDRMDLLQRGFPEGAVRVALTATPDYDDERVLCRCFPALIHEVTLEEALSLDLLAPTRVWVAEVDAEGSRVRILAGDYEEAMLGRVMSAAPFARAVEIFRYRGVNARLPAMIACASRQQAHDLQQYLGAHRPAGTPPPEVILGDTSPAERARILDGFETGHVDTLIQIGVLLEGWSSPRCKLLLDLAPTLSRVRATQKYFRVMTKREGAEARIYILLPKDLPEMPILPMELFGRSCREYECGELIGRTALPRPPRPPLDSSLGSPIQGVALRKRIVLSARLEAPKLAANDLAGLRAVLRSSRGFDPERPCNLHGFRAARFEHPLFSGRGESLLRWLGVAQTIAGYASLIARAFPGTAPSHLLIDPAESSDLPSCREDARHLLRALPRDPGSKQRRRDDAFAEGWRALTGHHDLVPLPPQTPLDRLLLREEADQIAWIIGQLCMREQLFLSASLGLFDQPARCLEDLAEDHEISRARVGQIVAGAARKLRGWGRRDASGVTWTLPPQRSERAPRVRRGLRAAAVAAWRAHDLASWTPMPAPLPVRDLLPRVGALLDRLGVSQAVTKAEPSVDRFVETGLEWTEARWKAGRISVELRRGGHVYLLPEGDEAVEQSVWAEVSGLPGKARLLLRELLGALERFTVDEDPAHDVDDAWRAVCGMESRREVGWRGSRREARSSR